MRVVFMGTPRFAVPALEHLVLNHHQVVAVYTQPDRPTGRGRSLVSSPVKKAAEALGLPVVQPGSLKREEAVSQLAELAPEVIVVAAFGQLLPPSILALPKFGCINIHPSLLPRFRGASPVAAAILAGDEFTGVSIMVMDKGLDTGPILARAQIPISDRDTTGLLTDKLSQVGARLLQEVLVRWVHGEITPQPQNEADASYCSEITKEAGEINWRLPAIDISRRVRAFQPWPGCYTWWQGKRLEIIEAVPLPGKGDVNVGQVVTLSPTGEAEGAAFGVGSGAGILSVARVQLEGKRAMSAAEFVRGQRNFIGAILADAA